MPSIKEVHDALGPYAGIVASVTTLGSAVFLIRPLRRMLLAFTRGLWAFLCGPSILMRQGQTIQEIANQLKTNGGSSLKDAVNRIEAHLKVQAVSVARLEKHHQSNFWSQPRPSIELDEHGQVNLVSEAACRLFQVSSQDELTRHSWLQFLDSREVAEFRVAFQDTAGTESMFRYTISIHDQQGGNRGVWEFKAAPLGAHLYSGYFSPVDSVAREISGRNSWLK
jgi:PAS domain-containing protein